MFTAAIHVSGALALGMSSSQRHSAFALLLGYCKWQIQMINAARGVYATNYNGGTSRQSMLFTCVLLSRSFAYSGLD